MSIQPSHISCEHCGLILRSGVPCYCESAIAQRMTDKAVREADAMRQPSGANTEQVGGEHYQSQPIQTWDFIAANNLGFFEGNVVKYVTRWRAKGGIEDLRKARHYLDKLIELEVAK